MGRGNLRCPAPREIDRLMSRVPRGRLTTIDDLRAAVAARHGATMGCPITTGIFAWIAAHAAAEQAATGRKRITPYWRTLKAKGELNPKYPGGIPELTRLLESEGHTIIRRGRRCFVADYEKHRMPLE